MKKIIIPLIIFVLLSIITFGVLTITYGDIPIDGTTVMRNTTINCTFRNSDDYTDITDVTLCNNFEGSWNCNDNMGYAEIGAGTNPYTFSTKANFTIIGTYLYHCEGYSNGTDIVENYTIGPNTVTNIQLTRYPTKYNYIAIVNRTNGGSTLEATYTVDYKLGTIIINLTNAGNVTRWNMSNVNITYTRNYTYLIENNKTIIFHSSPIVTLNSPSDNAINNWQNYINFSVNGFNPIYYCSIYTNETGDYTYWNTYTVSGVEINRTSGIRMNHDFPAKENIKWSVMCSEDSSARALNVYTFATNRTLSVDKTTPEFRLSWDYISNPNYVNSSTIKFYINLTDTHSGACKFFRDDLLNKTNNSLVSGTLWYYPLAGLTEGIHTFSFQCNDTANNNLTINITQAINITVDITKPSIKHIINATAYGYCDRFNITWNTTEVTNASLTYGVNSPPEHTAEITTTNSTGHNAIIMLNETQQNTQFGMNITSCDLAGNCNITAFFVNTSTKLCAGWREFALYGASKSLQSIQIDTQADYVFQWNHSAQAWKSWSSAGTGDSATVPYGGVYLLYSSVNRTFFRKTDAGMTYYANFTQGDNYLGVVNTSGVYDFENLASNLNMTIGGTGLNQMNIYYMSGYNNSNGKTVNYRYNWSWNKDTVLGRANYIEGVWFYSTNYNFTINTVKVIGTRTVG